MDHAHQSAIDDAGLKQSLNDLRAAFIECRSEIARRVSSARTTSEHEVLAIGDCVNSIVQEAKTLVADVERQLRSQADNETKTTALVNDMKASIQKQEAFVAKAMAQSAAILRAGRDVQAMASATRLLSLNARVEASRLGDQGSSFSVIADEMRELSHAVQQTNGSVAAMAKELERLLPEINAQTNAIQDGFVSFAKHVDARMQGIQSEQDRSAEHGPVIDKIVEFAYSALSHLAFQDPMAQSLEHIHDSLDKLQWKIDAIDGTSAAAGPPPKVAPVETENAPDIEAGELLLF